ncbi:[protein-PII] uridylyltransferase [Haloferula rosea]|uniref:Bifunctional uridylyltransferase/uridylyl-removing enzyme n=1 Tax=Haloferula rosea TaxID=490093 RepID=A0A934REF5_9BACT|nr:[protein-PII] uridylyltransferase [Haloferula rosea]MBK1827061.1 [protein-PII] uridylyltransferase [Haloferula rosea]
MSAHLKTLAAHAKKALKPASQGHLSQAERIALYKRFLKIEEHRIKLRHGAGGGGLEIAKARAELLDVVLRAVFKTALAKRKGKAPAAMTLMAIGGYGRGTLNPGSDIDLLFLVPRASNNLPKDLEAVVQEVLYLLWDVGFKVGHSCRSITECVQQAKSDQQNKTAMMDGRRITGDRTLFSTWRKRFEKEAVAKKQEAFFDLRRRDLRGRHKKYSKTVFLQEPNVKEGCGGMRDYHNILWVAHAKRGIRDLKKLVDARLLTRTAHREILEAYDFLHRVRNELHYQAGRGSDQLTLRLQGVVATNFRYPQRSILRRTEAFMRDYYTHTRHLYQHTNSLMEIFEIEEEESRDQGLVSFLTLRRQKQESFDGFIARDGRIYAENNDVFKGDPHQLMRMFQHTQRRNLRLSPPMRKLVKAHWEDIDRAFRYSKVNRDLFEAMLSRKGEVAEVLRRMHRVGFLGRYLPEFGALDCLVQHEFFHRYTADEHTLRFVEHIDALVDNPDPSVALFRDLLLNIKDPYPLYLAIILHDTGRSENVREHIDGSAMLAQRLCNRLQVRGTRRRMIMFLVDHHLTFWRYATTKNIDDPEVIAEFAELMKTPERLDALMLFTYADSNATSPDSWTSWKETLHRQLHRAARQYLTQGREKFEASVLSEKDELKEKTHKKLGESYAQEIEEHFERMPASYFRFRDPNSIPRHIKTIRQFFEREAKSNGAFECAGLATDLTDQGYTELVIASRDRPLFLEKVCCAIAAQGINILSADFHTRTDGVVVDIFRVCTTDFQPVTDPKLRERFLKTLYELGNMDGYDPSAYLKPKKNLLRPREQQGIDFPVRATISNDILPNCTTVEIQAIDRIGLLHDLLHSINKAGLDTVHARICTEKGAAMDTLYVTLPGGGQATDGGQLHYLYTQLEEALERR